MSGFGLAILMWLIVLFIALGLGRVTAGIAPHGIRHTLWFGFALLGVMASALSLSLLKTSTLAVLVVVALAAILGFVSLSGCFLPSRSDLGGGVATVIAFIFTFLVTLCLGAWMAVGEVQNYDTGLYHLQVIAIQARDGVAPGLAALHDRFGFTSSLWALGAVFERVVGQDVGFRLVPGLFLVFFVLEAMLRVGSPRSRRAPGTWLVLLGSMPLIAYGISYPGRTFAGIGQDWILASLWLLACAYALDWLASRRFEDFGAAMVIATVAGTVRPFGWLLLAGFVLMWVAKRGRGVLNAGMAWWVGIIAGVSCGMVFARDALASGWLLFPSSALPLPVPWRVDDPGASADAIRSWARSPFNPERADVFAEWFPGWLTRLGTDWMVVWCLAALGIAALLLTLSRRGMRRDARPHGKQVTALVLLQVAALGVWFVIAPDPRFAWGPLLVLGGITMISASTGISQRWMASTRIAWLPLAIIVIALSLSFIRDGDWWWSRTFTEDSIAVVEVPTPEVTVTDGVARTVGPDDRCWRAYVPCVPWYSPG